MMIAKKELFKHYNHLGFFNPYYVEREHELAIESKFADATAHLNNQKVIDGAAIVEILNRSFILGDRTLIKGIYKTPWMSKPDVNGKSWEAFKLPDHDEQEISELEIAKHLFEKICKEVLDYVGDNRNIGILLSGGMDSRMVVGALDYLIRNKTITNINVVGLTWGNKGSRDVEYAKRIAQLLKWDWKHFELTPDQFMDNINTSADSGAEYSAIHLHSMPQISKLKGLDCILAGSFGDSIGRAEYSGVKVKHIVPLGENFKNFGKILKVGIHNKYHKAIQSDINNYHKKFPQQKKYQQYEQDYQLHYMRRMLNPCMAIIHKNTPVYQIFSAPAVYSYMWSIAPKNRTDKVYEFMLDFFPTELKEIPWARTGIQYGKKGIPDKLAKRNHSYREMIAGDANLYISKLVLSDAIARLNIFNMDALKRLVKLIKEKPKMNFDYMEKLTWIASLSLMVEKYDVIGEKTKSNQFLNKLNGEIISPMEFYLKDMYRSFRG